MPTTHGTVVFKDYRPPRDAYPVELLRKAGAIILGKTTLSEYAAGDTYGSMFGVTRNPYDLERTVGGSSGGSGGALAANLATVAIGEETLASIRRPGAWNAVAALRPTPGLVSRSGMWDGHPVAGRTDGPDGAHREGPRHPARRHGRLRPGRSVDRARRRPAPGELRASPRRQRAQGRAHRHPAGTHRHRKRPDVGGLQEGRRRLREERRGAESRRRRRRRSDRDPGPQEADRHAHAQSGGDRRGAAVLSRAQSELAVQDPRGYRQIAGPRQELSAVQGRPVAEAAAAARPRAVPRVPGSARATDVQRVQGDGRPQARRYRAQIGGAAADPDQGWNHSALCERPRRADAEHVPRLLGVDDGAVRLHRATISRSASPSSRGPTARRACSASPIPTSRRPSTEGRRRRPPRCPSDDAREVMQT